MRKRGFTLIEVLVAIVIIAILAAIIVPNLLSSGREARETSLRAHLEEMRDAIRLFHAECDDYPGLLADLVSSEAPATGGTGKEIDDAKWKGPYLELDQYPGGLPNNPITEGNIEGEDWIYDQQTGEVHPAPGEALDGTDYSTW